VQELLGEIQCPGPKYSLPYISPVKVLLLVDKESRTRNNAEL